MFIYSFTVHWTTSLAVFTKSISISKLNQFPSVSKEKSGKKQYKETQKMQRFPTVRKGKKGNNVDNRCSSGADLASHS